MIAMTTRRHFFLRLNNNLHRRKLFVAPIAILAATSISPTHGFQVNRISNSAMTDESSRLPSLIVFDLDDCLWTPEMHELSSKPSIPVRGILNAHDDDDAQQLDGVVGLKNSHGETVTLFEGARRSLYELATNPIYKNNNNNVQIAVASSSLEPSYSHACLEGIEILPGQSIQSMLQYHQIGRSGKLSSRKTTHFRELHQDSGIPYEEMLFFDGMFLRSSVGCMLLYYGLGVLADF